MRLSEDRDRSRWIHVEFFSSKDDPILHRHRHQSYFESEIICFHDFFLNEGLSMYGRHRRLSTSRNEVYSIFLKLSCVFMLSRLFLEAL